MKTTIAEIIEMTDMLKEDNRFTQELKIKWISDLDMMIADEIIRKTEGGKNFQFAGYDKKTSKNTELIVPAPFSDMYIHWLHSKMDLFNQDYERYNSSVAAFYTVYQNFASFYNREHKPLQQGLKIF